MIYEVGQYWPWKDKGEIHKKVIKSDEGDQKGRKESFLGGFRKTEGSRRF